MTVGDAPLGESRRRFAIGCLAGALISVAGFVWMLTAGTGNLLQSNLFSNLYDVQARALFHGHWNVPAAALSIEGIREGSKTYMYYGPVPAILRMPILLITNRLDGRLTQLSMLAAFCVALWFAARLSWRVRSLVTTAPVSKGEAALAAGWMMVIGLGSQFLYLASDAIVYHEAELWGAALALGGLDFVVAFIVRPSRRSLLGAGLLSTLAILTRGSVGAGPVIALGVLGCAHSVVVVRRRWLGRHPNRSAHANPTWPWLALPEGSSGSTWVIGLLVAAAIPVVLYVAINEVKFHTLVSLPLNKQVFTSINLNRRITLADNGGSLFGLKFIPTGLLQYLRPDAIGLSRLFPFLKFPPKATLVGNVHYDTRDFASSITTTMPVLTLLSVAGVIGVFRRKRPGRAPDLSALRVPLFGAALGTLGVLAIAFVANRYLADFMPVLLLAAPAGLALVAAGWGRWRSVTRWSVAALLALLALFGFWVNAGLGLVYQRELRPSAPQSERQELVSLQQRIDRDLFGSDRPEVTRTAALPRVGPPGALDIVGSCVGLYQSDGLGWRAVERSSSDGHLALNVVFPSASTHGLWPVAVNGARGAGDFLAARSAGRGRVQFVYIFQGYGLPTLYGRPFSVVPGRHYLVDVVFDALVHQVSVQVDGTNVLTAVLVRSNRPIHVGNDPLHGPTLVRFPGRIERLPVTTPICDGLLARLERRG